MKPLFNFLIFLLLLGFIGGCGFMVAQHKEKYEQLVCFGGGHEVADKFEADSIGSPAFILCMLIAVAAVVTFMVLMVTSPVFNTTITIILILWGAHSVANFIKRWWHSP